MFHRFLLFPLVVCTSLAVVWSQFEHTGVLVEVFPDGGPVGDLTEIDSTAVDLRLKCESAIYPTEWVFDVDVKYLNKSFVRLHCDKFESDFSLVCRSVTNQSDNLLVRLEPNHTSGRLYITKQRGVWTDKEKSKSAGSSGCVQFTLAQTKFGKYWKCHGPDGKRGEIAIWHCASSTTCANTERKLKLEPVCVHMTDQINWADQGWLQMSKEKITAYPAGGVVCKLDDGNGKHRGAAVEFFFVGQDKSTIHFSLSEISMNDLIWFDPLPTSTTFYTLDKLETRCKVSDYGLSWDPSLKLKINGSVALLLADPVNNAKDSTRMQKVIINFNGELFGPGSYEIECSALVWNTSEWASKSLKFEVRAVVPPYFDVEPEFITVNEGATNAPLHCGAHGDPAPNTTWSHRPELDTVGRQPVYRTLLAQWVNGSTISCYAMNKYGQRAVKTFKVYVTSDEADTELPLPSWAIGAIAAFVSIVLLAVSIALGYVRFIKFGRAAAKVLTDEEVKEFHHGWPLPSTAESEEDQLAIGSLSYNSEFEVAKENIYVDFNRELGFGQYGVVYAGHIKQGHSASPIQVAVKTVRPNVHIDYFKALMSELKILAYISHHDNIAKLMGAYSINIQQRELLVAIELCKTSLVKHLRKNVTKFTAESFPSEGRGGAGNCNFEPIKTLDLIRWSAQIAAGMEYLADIRVVHADLAARNVLLSFENRAKICDFGLARQLVNYSYIKKTDCPLPWQWMAIETLRHRHYSTLSDVWSYGVTCWEIFSLGDVPYPCVTWNWEFVDTLEAGFRLKKPKHASQEIFNTLKQCWYERRDRRPLFSELKQFFQELEQQLSRNGGDYVSSDELYLEAESEF